MRRGKCENCKKCIKVIDSGELFCGRTKPIRKIVRDKDNPKWCPRKRG